MSDNRQYTPHYLVKTLFERDRLRKALELLIGRAWNLNHTEPRKKCALCIGVKEARAAILKARGE